MILVIVCDQNVVDDFGEVFVRVAGDIALVGVAKNWIKKDTYIARFEQDASMTEVAPTSAFAVIASVRPGLFTSEKRAKPRSVLVAKAENFADFFFGRR